MNLQDRNRPKNLYLGNKNKSIIKIPKFINPFKYSRSQRILLRETKWNNRFIYNKIPNYDSSRDKNVICGKKHNNLINSKKIDHYINTKTPKNYSLNQTNIDSNNNVNCLNCYSPSNYVKKDNIDRIKTMYSKKKKYNIILNNCCSQNYIKMDNPSLTNLNQLWDELEISFQYRNYFHYIYKELEPEYKEELYQKEIQELDRVKLNIKTLKYNIALRTGTIEEIKSLNEKLGKELLNKNNNAKESLLNEISNKITILREHTIKVCQSMKQLKESIFTINNLGKYNLDSISKKYKFDKNYIIKMKAELIFFREGFSKYFFNIENDQTPFLLKASDKNKVNKEDYFLRIIPLNDELKNDIIDCIFYIHQELIAYQNVNYKKKDFRKISPIKRNDSNLNYNLNNNMKNMKEENKNENNYDNNNTSEVINMGTSTDREKMRKINGSDDINNKNKCFESYIGKVKDKTFEANKNRMNGYNTSINFHNIKKSMTSKIKALMEEDEVYDDINKKENYDKDQLASYNFTGTEDKNNNLIDKIQPSVIIGDKKNENESKMMNSSNKKKVLLSSEENK